jgi:hypothetical protein
MLPLRTTPAQTARAAGYWAVVSGAVMTPYGVHRTGAEMLAPLGERRERVRALAGAGGPPVDSNPEALPYK